MVQAIQVFLLIYVKAKSSKQFLTFVNGMDKRFKESTCLKTPANSNLISEVYKNSMDSFTRYIEIRKEFEAEIMSNIENSLQTALCTLNTEKVKYVISVHFKAFI